MHAGGTVVELKSVRGVPRIVVQGTNTIARNANTPPVDGGREHCKERPKAVAVRQVRHINGAK